MTLAGDWLQQLVFKPKVPAREATDYQIINKISLKVKSIFHQNYFQEGNLVQPVQQTRRGECSIFTSYPLAVDYLWRHFK